MLQELDNYPKVSLSETDKPLPKYFSNGFTRYANFKPMAKGGKAELYTCFDKILGRTVAFKTLHRAIVDDEYEKRRFIREARVTAQLQHPCTVPVYDLGLDVEGRLYFTMKKVEGETLREVITLLQQNDAHAEATYTLEKILGVLIQVCSAIAYAHAHGVVHRDIKPANILVGSFGEVVLLDWGVAKVWDLSQDEERLIQQEQQLTSLGRDDEEQVQRLTGTGKRPGTPLYMSPEQVEGKEDIDERTDIYTMGVVLYEMLTLEDASRGETVKQTFHNIVSVDPEPPRKVAPERHIPQALEEITMKALAKRREDRYESMLDLVDDIRKFRNEALEYLERRDES
ncbi:MAG TPA: serine/threonine-protein kinase [Planctomycetaceae bacterium]|nr:serine/threonine-protein kinase [Planctomycetaceae bacterium]